MGNRRRPECPGGRGDRAGAPVGGVRCRRRPAGGRALRALFTLLGAFEDDGEILAQLDALGILDEPLACDLVDLVKVYLRGVLRERAARPEHP
ncbi:MAG TPA: hypothetical protein VFL91_32175 [Thermomicrobiales bacterium]|nr:hypothetical protein [Thermomicrobiales bacterium]